MGYRNLFYLFLFTEARNLEIFIHSVPFILWRVRVLEWRCLAGKIARTEKKRERSIGAENAEWKRRKDKGQTHRPKFSNPSFFLEFLCYFHESWFVLFAARQIGRLIAICRSEGVQNADERVLLLQPALVYHRFDFSKIILNYSLYFSTGLCE